MESIASLQIKSIEQVRSRIAQLILGEPDQHITIGKIELRPHQRSAVLRLRESLRQFGGAVLCDPVGTGKTFIALAIAPADARLLVVAPAILKGMWCRALELSDRSADFISFESLSRGALPEDVHNFVIVDEAHHARNPKTVRYRSLSQIVSRSHVLLLTATPIHNKRADLVALISIFLGERAASLTPSELARCVIRRDQVRDSIDGMPAVETLTWMRLREDHRIPKLLLSLPPPLPPRDGGDGGVLITRSLMRQWASSDAALTGGLRRRIVRAESLIAALSDNTWPTRQELLSWISGDDSVQLGFPGILAAESSDSDELLDVVRKHLEGLKVVGDVLRGSLVDNERASLIRRIRQAHCDRGIVAFSEYADTIRGLFGQLMNDGRVCALTGSGACVAGGPISRADAIARFAPNANGLRQPSKANAITLLLTTDLLSEGVNLQDAGVVIHLDLPWTPARMEQRLGRVARVGSSHERIPSYAFRPPITSEAVIRIERILREKLAAAGIVVPGRSFLPEVYEDEDCETVPQRNEAIRSLVSEWLEDATEADVSSMVAAVSANRAGYIAVADVGGAIRVLAGFGNQVSENPESILDALQQCSGTQVEVDPREIVSCESATLSWIAADLALPSSRAAKHATTSIRRVVIRRINRILRDASTHQRARLAAKTDKALAGISNRLGAYDELQLLRASEQSVDGEQFIDRIIELTGEQAQPARRAPRILAMIVLVRK